MPVMLNMLLKLSENDNAIFALSFLKYKAFWSALKKLSLIIFPLLFVLQYIVKANPLFKVLTDCKLEGYLFFFFTLFWQCPPRPLT